MRLHWRPKGSFRFWHCLWCFCLRVKFCLIFGWCISEWRLTQWRYSPDRWGRASWGSPSLNEAYLPWTIFLHLHNENLRIQFRHMRAKAEEFERGLGFPNMPISHAFELAEELRMEAKMDPSQHLLFYSRLRSQVACWSCFESSTKTRNGDSNWGTRSQNNASFQPGENLQKLNSLKQNLYGRWNSSHSRV